MAAITKSERSHISTAVVSCSRLRQVQDLLRSKGETVIDAILCTLGIDSRYNNGCSELACYLFCDLYKQNHFNMDQIPGDFTEEVLDDVIILIKAECVHLYCNPVNYWYLLSYVSHWRNLHLHCLTETEYEDEEMAEEFKISSFVSMVQDCRCIGVPYSSSGHDQKFDMFMLEKWPIIQAFALEGIGAGVFFTMKHKLVDISQQLWKVYSRYDPVSLDCLLTKDLQLFERQWNDLFSSMGIESPVSMQEVSEAQVAEPFRTYYSHGLISSNITDKSKNRQPFVLFGRHSSMEELENYCFTFPSEGHQVRNTGPSGSFAKHMLLQCVAPKGPLACARTFFFGTTHVPYLGNNISKPKNIELLVLSQIYSATVQSVLAGIKCFSITSNNFKAKDVADQTFQQTLDKYGLFQYKGALRSKVVFNIQAVNNEGVNVSLSDENSCFLIKTASMSVHDIPDLLHGGNLGSVVFSESFLQSSIYIQHKDGTFFSDSCFTILTSSIPRYVSWLVEEADVRMSEQAQSLVKQQDGSCLGLPLTARESAYLISASLLSTADEGKLVFFTEGILFVHPHYGTVTLSTSHINTIKLCDAGALSDISVLFFEYHSSLLPHIPFPLHGTDFSLAIALLPRTKSRKSFYSQVLPVWRKSDVGLRLQQVPNDQLSSEHRTMYARLLKLCETQAPMGNGHATLSRCDYPQPHEQDRFLQHFAISSSVGEECVCIDHLPAINSNVIPDGLKYDSTNKVILTIITGLPGSNKERLCDLLMQVTENRSKWDVVFPASEKTEEFSAPYLCQFLSNIVIKRNETGLCPSRILLLVPGYTDVMDVIQVIVTHPDADVRSGVTVGAVSACVNPLTSFIKHRLFFPKLLEQCSQGVVSNVIFTGLTSDHKHPILKHLQKMIRAANPTTTFILAEKGAVVRTEDICLILSESSFSQPHMIKARYLLYPGWWKGRFVSGCGSVTMSHYRIEFIRPLERALFMLHCKALKSSLKLSPFTGNIYHISGKVTFSDNDRQMVVNCNSISGNVTITPEQGIYHGPQTTTNSYLTFHGVGLTLEGMKDWLRQCAKQRAQKKMKKNQRTLTPQEIKHIHVKRRLDPLPSGYFYNGHQFVSFFGEKQNLHPCILYNNSFFIYYFICLIYSSCTFQILTFISSVMDKFIEEYVQEANKEIELFNREVDLQPHADLFDP